MDKQIGCCPVRLCVKYLKRRIACPCGAFCFRIKISAFIVSHQNALCAPLGPIDGFCPLVKHLKSRILEEQHACIHMICFCGHIADFLYTVLPNSDTAQNHWQHSESHQLHVFAGARMN